MFVQNLCKIGICCHRFTNFAQNKSNIRNSTYQRFFTYSTIMSCFEGRIDRFNGITVLSKDEPLEEEAIDGVLKKSLQNWEAANMRGIWFKVYLKHSHWVPVLAKNGFTFHHAQEEYVMMLKWLPKDESPNVPPYAHTMIGVGAAVINDNDEVLVVNEKYNKLPHWKLPGGYVEPGENLVDAAIREVWEETNIHTEFQSVLSFRHAHGGQFGNSDIYVVVKLKPLSLEIKMCERELSDCKWMKIDKYLTHPDIHELNRFFIQKYLDNKSDNMKIECTHGIHQVLKKPYTVYHTISSDKV